MKYLKKFQTNADYQAFRGGGDWITPNISIIVEDDSIVYEPIQPPVLITFTLSGIEYQAEEGMTWEDFVNSDYNHTILVGSTSLKEFILLSSNYIGHNSTSGTVMYITLNGINVTLNEQVCEQEYGIRRIY